jgi:hypothetical protein
MIAVMLVTFKKATHTLTAFKFACSILHAGPLRVVPSHVLIHVGIAPDSLLTIWTFVDARRTLDLQVNAICFLILVSALSWVKMIYSLFRNGQGQVRPRMG